MGPKFDKIALSQTAKLLVEGPFETHGEVIDDVVVRILIRGEGITAPEPSPLRHWADLIGDSPAQPPHSTGAVQYQRAGSGLAVGRKVLAIGLSVAERADHPDPSAFETFTWCVRVKVIGDGATPRRRTTARSVDRLQEILHAPQERLRLLDVRHVARLLEDRPLGARNSSWI